MRVTLAKLMDHLIERLSPDEDGKKKKLSPKTIGHLNEFLSSFELMNVADDTAMETLVGQVRDVMAGVDHKRLKKDTQIATHVHDELEKVKALLEPMIEGNRMITLDDD
jgi:hypothetical protein